MGKARIFSDGSRDAVYQKEADNEVYSAAAQQNSYNLGSTHFSDQSGIGNFTQAGSDQRKASVKGALFQGNVGFDQQTVELDVATFTINLLNDGAGTALSISSTDRFVSLSAGTTGDLTTITGVQRPGQRLVLYNTLTNTITIKHTAAATANTIRTPDGGDFEFLPDMAVALTYDITSTQWRIISGGGGGLSEPVILTINTITPQTLPTTSVVDWSKNPNHITLDRDVEFSFSNLPASGSYEGVLVIIDVDATGGYASPVWPASVTNAPNVSTTASTRTSVMLYTIDGGTVVTHATSVGSTGTTPDLWANFPAVSDVDFATFDGIDIDRLLFDQSAGSTLVSTTTGLTSNASGDILANVPTGGALAVSINSEPASQLELVGGRMIYQVRGDSTDIPTLRTLQQKGSAPTVGSAVGDIQFYGTDSTGTTQEQFGSISVDYEDTTIGSVDGSMHLQVEKASLQTAFISLNNSNDNLVRFWKNQIFNVGVDLEMNENDLWFDTTKLDRIYHSGTQMNFDVDAALQFFVIAGGIALATTAKSATLPNISMTPHDLAPLNLDGNMKYDLSEDKFIVYESGAWVNMIVGTQTTTGDIQFSVGGSDVLKIQSAGALNWNLSGIDHTLTAGATTMTMKLDQATDQYLLQFANANNEFIFDAGHVDVRMNGTLGFFFESLHNPTTPIDDMTIALYQWNGKNSISTIEPHAELQLTTTDVTDGTEDCDFVFSEMVSGVMTEMVRIDANLNEIHFANGSDLDLQAGNIDNFTQLNADSGAIATITGSRGGNAALASLLSALETYGMIVDSTT